MARFKEGFLVLVSLSKIQIEPAADLGNFLLPGWLAPPIPLGNWRALECFHLPFLKPPNTSDDIEANGHCGFQIIVWALEHGQDAFMEVQKEIHVNLKLPSEFYLNQGFLNQINRVAQRIHMHKLGPCDIDHWMSIPTTEPPFFGLEDEG
ncbi:uncharacterized protein VP01_1165g3 [Puccinia sorghi]|uniref:Uncharacterized protein n=1 Tax=Puccinia sorghi TaxID=27349 RepID=A0A0L6VRD9_9BASI|nr:uncharacterized protein VP01_1165g3 [Puccinia sorghi]